MAVRQQELVELLAQSLGEQKATEVVEAAASRLSVRVTADGNYPVKDAMHILENIADQPGLVGITAQFAIGRVIFKWGAKKRA